MIFTRKRLVCMFTGIIALSYWVTPIIQEYAYSYFADRIEDWGGVLAIPVNIFQSLYMISPGLALVLQTLLALFTWYVLFAITKLLIPPAPANLP